MHKRQAAGRVPAGPLQAVVRPVTRSTSRMKTDATKKKTQPQKQRLNGYRCEQRKTSENKNQGVPEMEAYAPPKVLPGDATPQSHLINDRRSSQNTEDSPGILSFSEMDDFSVFSINHSTEKVVQPCSRTLDEVPQPFCSSPSKSRQPLPDWSLDVAMQEVSANLQKSTEILLYGEKAARMRHKRRVDRQAKHSAGSSGHRSPIPDPFQYHVDTSDSTEQQPQQHHSSINIINQTITFSPRLNHSDEFYVHDDSEGELPSFETAECTDFGAQILPEKEEAQCRPLSANSSDGEQRRHFIPSFAEVPMPGQIAQQCSRVHEALDEYGSVHNATVTMTSEVVGRTMVIGDSRDVSVDTSVAGYLEPLAERVSFVFKEPYSVDLPHPTEDGKLREMRLRPGNRQLEKVQHLVDSLYDSTYSRSDGDTNSMTVSATISSDMESSGFFSDMDGRQSSAATSNGGHYHSQPVAKEVPHGHQEQTCQQQPQAHPAHADSNSVLTCDPTKDNGLNTTFTGGSVDEKAKNSIGETTTTTFGMHEERTTYGLHEETTTFDSLQSETGAISDMSRTNETLNLTGTLSGPGPGHQPAHPPEKKKSKTRMSERANASKKTSILQERPSVPNKNVPSKLKAMLSEPCPQNKMRTKKQNKWDAVMAKIQGNRKLSQCNTSRTTDSGSLPSQNNSIRSTDSNQSDVKLTSICDFDTRPGTTTRSQNKIGNPPTVNRPIHRKTSLNAKPTAKGGPFDNRPKSGGSIDARPRSGGSNDTRPRSGGSHDTRSRKGPSESRPSSGGGSSAAGPKGSPIEAAPRSVRAQPSTRSNSTISSSSRISSATNRLASNASMSFKGSSVTRRLQSVQNQKLENQKPTTTSTKGPSTKVNTTKAASQSGSVRSKPISPGSKKKSAQATQPPNKGISGREKRSEDLGREKTAKEDALKTKLLASEAVRSNAVAFDAMAILFGHYANRVPLLEKELALAQKDYIKMQAENKNAVESLHANHLQEKDCLEADHAQRLQVLETNWQARLEDMKEALSSQASLNLTKSTQELRSRLEKEKEVVSLELTHRLEACNSEKKALEEKLKLEMAKTEKLESAKSSQHQTPTHQPQEKGKQVGSKMEALRTKISTLEQEVTSLRCVLEMKTEELHDSRTTIMKLNERVHELQQNEESLRKANNINEDLKAQLISKDVLEKKLLEENRLLMSQIHKEAGEKKRLSMMNEQLTWKLQCQDTSDSFCESMSSIVGGGKDRPLSAPPGKHDISLMNLSARLFADNFDSPQPNLARVSEIIEKSEAVSWKLEYDSQGSRTADPSPRTKRKLSPHSPMTLRKCKSSGLMTMSLDRSSFILSRSNSSPGGATRTPGVAGSTRSPGVSRSNSVRRKILTTFEPLSESTESESDDSKKNNESDHHVEKTPQPVDIGPVDDPLLEISSSSEIEVGGDYPSLDANSTFCVSRDKADSSTLSPALEERTTFADPDTEEPPTENLTLTASGHPHHHKERSSSCEDKCPATSTSSSDISSSQCSDLAEDPELDDTSRDIDLEDAGRPEDREDEERDRFTEATSSSAKASSRAHAAGLVSGKGENSDRSINFNVNISSSLPSYYLESLLGPRQNGGESLLDAGDYLPLTSARSDVNLSASGDVRNNNRSSSGRRQLRSASSQKSRQN